MERKKGFIVTTIFIFLLFTANASYKTDIYRAFINNKMDQWQATIDKMEKNKQKDNGYLLQLVNFQYGYIAWCISMKDDKKAASYLKLAEKNLAQLEDQNASMASINAYKSAFYGFRIGLSPFKAPFLGPKSVRYSKSAIEQDANNPLGYIQYGNAQFYMPPVFGGSKQVAIEYFYKALHLMEKNKSELNENWNYLNLLVIIGQSYEQTGQLKEAKLIYEKALNIEPQFLFMKDELYPELLKKINDLNE